VRKDHKITLGNSEVKGKRWLDIIAIIFVSLVALGGITAGFIFRPLASGIVLGSVGVIAGSIWLLYRVIEEEFWDE